MARLNELLVLWQEYTQLDLDDDDNAGVALAEVRALQKQYRVLREAYGEYDVGRQ